MISNLFNYPVDFLDDRSLTVASCVLFISTDILCLLILVFFANWFSLLVFKTNLTMSEYSDSSLMLAFAISLQKVMHLQDVKVLRVCDLIV